MKCHPSQLTRSECSMIQSCIYRMNHEYVNCCLIYMVEYNRIFTVMMVRKRTLHPLKQIERRQGVRHSALSSLYHHTAALLSVASSRKGRSAIRGVSVASQFRSSLQLLVSDLEKTAPHFIRCIKPNSKKEANSLDSGEVLRQLRYAGMMETIRIR